jgi:hypothetical protein
MLLWAFANGHHCHHCFILFIEAMNESIYYRYFLPLGLLSSVDLENLQYFV